VDFIIGPELRPCNPWWRSSMPIENPALENEKGRRSGLFDMQ